MSITITESVLTSWTQLVLRDGLVVFVRGEHMDEDTPRESLQMLAYLAPTTEAEVIGILDLKPPSIFAPSWTVWTVETHPGYVRRGLATAMYRLAQGVLGPIGHSEMRTVYGTAWAESVGGDLPKTREYSMCVDTFQLWETAMEEGQSEKVIASYFGAEDTYSPLHLPVGHQS